MWKDLEISITPRTPEIMIETHTMLEYIIAAHGLFTEMLLNRHRNLSKHNIEGKSSALILILDYFTSWNEERGDVTKDEK